MKLTWTGFIKPSNENAVVGQLYFPDKNLFILKVFLDSNNRQTEIEKKKTMGIIADLEKYIVDKYASDSVATLKKYGSL